MDTWMKFWLARAGVVVVALLSAAPSCSDTRACTLMGCTDNLRIEFPAALEDGDWLFEITEGDSGWLCEVTVPVAESHQPTCSGFDVSFDLRHRGGAFYEVRGLVLQWAPERIDLTIGHDGDLLGSQVIEPSYEDLYPNGPECDPVPCHQASVTVDPEALSP